MTDKRYIVLRAYCWLLKISSALLIVLALVGAAQILLNTPTGSGGLVTPAPSPQRFDSPVLMTPPAELSAIFARLAGWGSVIFALSLALSSWALADYLAAHMSTEENTREMVELMRQQLRQQRPVNPIDYPYDPRKSRQSSLNRYEETPLGQYMDRQQRR